MGRKQHVMFFVSYTVLAASAAVALPRQFPGISSFAGIFIGQFLFLASAILHESICRRNHEDQSKRHIRALKRAYDELKGEFADFKGELRGELTRIVEILNSRKPAAQRREQATRARDPAAPAGSPPDWHGEDWYAPIRDERALAEKRSAINPHYADDQQPAAQPQVVGNKTGKTKWSFDNIVAQTNAARFSHDEMIIQVREALQAKRLGLMAQPIVTLPNGAIQYYELFANLQTAEGARISAADYVPVAEKSGQLALIDGALMQLTFDQLESISEPLNESNGVFVNLAAGTLRDNTMLDRMIGFLRSNSHLARQVILEVSQKDFNQNQRSMKTALSRLGDLGFTLSMDNVTDLSLNPSTLANLGFRFVKISATTLSRALKRAPSRYERNIQSLKKDFDANGVRLIVDRVEDKAVLELIAPLAPKVAQGYLFGRPAPLNDAQHAQYQQRRRA